MLGGARRGKRDGGEEAEITMRRTLLLALFIGLAVAQTTSTLKVGGKTWPLALLPSVATLTCDKTALAPGDSSTCTLTLDMNAPSGGFTLPVSVDAPLTAPTTVTLAAEQKTATLIVARP
jgi:hypothetical protein